MTQYHVSAQANGYYTIEWETSLLGYFRRHHKVSGTPHGGWYKLPQFKPMGLDDSLLFDILAGNYRDRENLREKMQ